jgi:hypothetical protein
MSRSGLLAVAFGACCVSLAGQSREAAPSGPQASVKLQPGDTAVPGECLTKEELDLNRRLLALTRPTRGVESEQNADDQPRFNPEYFVGTWNIEGVLPESPLGAAGEITGVDTVRHVRDCTYESTLQAKAPGGAFTVKSLITYDREARQLAGVEQDSRGFQIRKTGPVGGDAGGYFSHHWQAEAFTYKGTRVRVQGISFFASPGNYRVRMQMALDNQPFTAYGTLWWTRAGTTR